MSAQSENTSSRSLRGSTTSKPGKDKKVSKQKGSEVICLDCKKSVKESDEAVECEVCKLWCHKSCQGMSDGLYAVINSDETEQITWYCKGCQRGAKNILTQILSISEKQENLEKQVRVIDLTKQKNGKESYRN